MASKIFVSGISDPAIAAEAVRRGADFVCVTVTDDSYANAFSGFVSLGKVAEFGRNVPPEKLIIGLLSESHERLFGSLNATKAHAVVMPNHDRGRTFAVLAEEHGVQAYDYLVYESPSQLREYVLPKGCAGVWLGIPVDRTRNLRLDRLAATVDLARRYPCVLQQSASHVAETAERANRAKAHGVVFFERPFTRDSLLSMEVLRNLL